MRIILIILSLVGLLTAASDIEPQALDLNNCKSMIDVLEGGGVFYKYYKSLNAGDDGNIYILSGTPVTIFKINRKSFHLIKTIAQGGQGPGELTCPIAMSVNNGKIYVMDSGFVGIKIFDQNGNAITEFKCKMEHATPADRYCIAVNKKEEIFIKNIKKKTMTSVSVYNSEGKLLRDIVPVKVAEMQNGIQDFAYESNFSLSIDAENNLFILYNLTGELKKVNSNGKLLWKTNLKQFLDKEKKKFKGFDGYYKKRSWKMKVSSLYHGLTVFGKKLLVSDNWGKGHILDTDSGIRTGLIEMADGKKLGSHLLVLDNQLITYKQFLSKNR